MSNMVINPNIPVINTNKNVGVAGKNVSEKINGTPEDKALEVNLTENYVTSGSTEEIKDAGDAKGVIAKTLAGMLQQATATITAQANQNPQSVLKLLE